MGMVPVDKLGGREAQEGIPIERIEASGTGTLVYFDTTKIKADRIYLCDVTCLTSDRENVLTVIYYFYSDPSRRLDGLSGFRTLVYVIWKDGKLWRKYQRAWLDEANFSPFPEDYEAKGYIQLSEQPSTIYLTDKNLTIIQGGFITELTPKMLGK